MRKWLAFVRDIEQCPVMVLCGNKTDLAKAVRTEEGRDFAKKEKMLFFEVSAKLGFNVNQMVYTAISHLSVFDEYRDSSKDLPTEIENENGEDVVEGEARAGEQPEEKRIVIDKLKSKPKRCNC